ncbi:MAG: leucine-rich repeat protein [Eubacteriales bacterium]
MYHRTSVFASLCGDRREKGRIFGKFTVHIIIDKNKIILCNNQPDGMVYIEKTAFRLKGIVPDGVVIEIKPGTLNINSSAFYNCSSVASVVIPDTVTTIGENAFFGCSALKA